MSGRREKRQGAVTPHLLALREANAALRKAVRGAPPEKAGALALKLAAMARELAAAEEAWREELKPTPEEDEALRIELAERLQRVALSYRRRREEEAAQAGEPPPDFPPWE